MLQAADLSTSNGSLTINGVVISAADPVPSKEDLAALVNAQTAATNVQAKIDPEDGAFVLTNVAGKEGNAIVLAPQPGVLSTYSGTVLPDRYLNKPWQAGQISRSTTEVLADGSQHLRSEARIEGEAVPATVGNGAPIIAAGALNLNGKALSELAIGVGQPVTSADVAAWLQDNIDNQAVAL